MISGLPSGGGVTADAAFALHPAAAGSTVRAMDAAPPPTSAPAADATARPDRLLQGALVLASLMLALPMLLPRWLPLLDLPQHVGAVAILAGGPEDWAFSRYYTVDLLRSPYLLPYLIAAGLAKLVGAKLAVHALFALAAGLWPFATATALGGFGRDRHAALLLAPLAYGTFVFMGFLNFALSLPIFLFWLGWFRGRVSAARWRARDGWIGAALGIGLYYGHVMSFAFALGAAGLIVLLTPTLPGRSAVSSLGVRALRALHLAPGAALLTGWALFSETAGKGELGRMVGGAMAHEPPRWDAPLDRAKQLFDHMLATYHDKSDEWLLYALWAGLAASALARRAPERNEGDGPRALPLALWSAAVACALFLPATYRGIWPIAARMAPFVLALLVLLPAGRLRWPRGTLALGLGLTLATAWTHTARLQRFEAEVGPLEAALEPLPPGSKLMTLVFDKYSRVVTWPAFLHVSQYALATRGGVAEFSFVNFTKSPIHYVESEAPPRLPARFEWTPERYDHRTWGTYYDHVLVRGPAARAEALFRRGGPAMREVVRAGPWTLFARVDDAAPPTRPAGD